LESASDAVRDAVRKALRQSPETGTIRPNGHGTDTNTDAVSADGSADRAAGFFKLG